MDINHTLHEMEYSKSDTRIIRDGLSNLSYPHRRQIYELLTEYPEFKKPFFGALLSANYAQSEGTKEAADEILGVYQDMLTHMGV
mgnify:CR=1 FL=1